MYCRYQYIPVNIFALFVFDKRFTERGGGAKFRVANPDSYLSKILLIFIYPTKISDLLSFIFEDLSRFYTFRTGFGLFFKDRMRIRIRFFLEFRTRSFILEGRFCILVSFSRIRNPVANDTITFVVKLLQSLPAISIIPFAHGAFIRWLGKPQKSAVVYIETVVNWIKLTLIVWGGKGQIYPATRVCTIITLL